MNRYALLRGLQADPMRQEDQADLDLQSRSTLCWTLQDGLLNRSNCARWKGRAKRKRGTMSSRRTAFYTRSMVRRSRLGVGQIGAY
jgi:hypothetical protein